MTKIVKWERFYLDESMWEVTRKPGVNLLPHELEMIQQPLEDEHCSLIITYANGQAETLKAQAHDTE